MRRIKIEVMYEGTNFVGFQVQPKGESVQSTLESALEKVLGEKVRVVASGRTDAGVHAICQVCHFDTKNTVAKMDNIVRGTNIYLPAEVKVISATEVDKNFHAKNSAKKKTYQYFCYLSKTPLPLFENRAMQVGFDVDVENMQKAAKFLVGKHDFSSFCAANSGRNDFVRNVLSIEIRQAQLLGFDLIVFEICGEGFLYRMVRNIVGTLLEVGGGKRSAKDVKEILEAKDRKKAGRTAPACGLYLTNVNYITRG